MMHRSSLLLAACLALMAAGRVEAAAAPPACIAWCPDALCAQPAIVSCVAFNKKLWPVLFNVTADAKVKLSKTGPTVTTSVDGELYVASGRVKANVNQGFNPFVPLNGVVQLAAGAAAAVGGMCKALLNAKGDAIVNLAVGSVKIYSTGQFVVECQAALSPLPLK